MFVSELSQSSSLSALFYFDERKGKHLWHLSPNKWRTTTNRGLDRPASPGKHPLNLRRYPVSNLHKYHWNSIQRLPWRPPRRPVNNTGKPGNGYGQFQYDIQANSHVTAAVNTCHNLYYTIWTTAGSQHYDSIISISTISIITSQQPSTVLPSGEWQYIFCMLVIKQLTLVTKNLLSVLFRIRFCIPRDKTPFWQ